MAVPISAVLKPTRTIRSRKTEDDGESLLKSLGRRTLSGVAAVGNLLDLPGSSARDFLTGNNPLDQWLSPLSGENRVSGRDMLEQYGVLGPNQNGFDLGDVGGFAAEVATDPLSFLGGFGTLKALGKGGSILAKASPLAKGLSRTERIGTTVAQLAPKIAPDALEAAARGAGFSDAAAFLGKHGGESVGGLASLNLPLGGPLKAIGTGPTALKVAGALDKAGSAVRFSYPGRLGASLFSHSNMGAMTKEGQQLAQNVTRRMGEADFAARADVADIVRGFHEAGVLKDQGALRSVVQSLEGVAPLPQNLAGLQPHVDKMRQLLDDILPAEQAAHLKSGALNDVVQYMTRRLFQFADRPSGMPSWLSNKLFKTTHPSQIRREDFLRELFGGTDVINEISLNPQWSGIVKRTGQKLTKPQIKQMGQDIENFLQQRTGQYWTLNPGQGESLARWLSELDPRYADEGVPIFGTNPVENVLGRMEHGYRAIQASEGVRDALSQWGQDAAALPFGSPTLKQVVEKSGLAESAAQEIAQKLGMNVDDVAIPADRAADVLRVMKPFSTPENVNELLKNYDKLTNLYKSSLTTLFPAFHSRNFASGAIQNMLTGMFSMRSYGTALRTLHGDKVVKGLTDIPAFRGMTDAQATNALRDVAFAAGVVDPVQGLASAGDAYGTKLASLMPGLEPTGIKQAFKNPRPVGTTALQAANPLNIAGVGTAQDVFYPARVGREVGRSVESVNRLAPFIELLRKGFSPQEAAERVKAAHVDYSAMSDFERSAVKRIFPFASFTKGMASFVTDELLNRPGGRLGQTIRAQNSARGESPMPEHISQGAAIPLGASADGTESYLAGLGLMTDDPLSMLSARNGAPDVSGMLAEGISRANPVLKLPIELASGESFFQRSPLGGRDLQDLDPAAGRILTNIGLRDELPSGRARPLLSTEFENILSNLPTSRLMTTARTLTDPRKYQQGVFPGSDALLNVGTGLRVSQISPAASDAVLRDEADAAMAAMGAQSYNVTRFSKAQLEAATPEERALMEQYNAIKDELLNRSKSRRKK